MHKQHLVSSPSVSITSPTLRSVLNTIFSLKNNVYLKKQKNKINSLCKIKRFSLIPETYSCFKCTTTKNKKHESLLVWNWLKKHESCPSISRIQIFLCVRKKITQILQYTILGWTFFFFTNLYFSCCNICLKIILETFKKIFILIIQIIYVNYSRF